MFNLPYLSTPHMCPYQRGAEDCWIHKKRTDTWKWPCEDRGPIQSDATTRLHMPWKPWEAGEGRHGRLSIALERSKALPGFWCFILDWKRISFCCLRHQVFSNFLERWQEPNHHHHGGWNGAQNEPVFCFLDGAKALSFNRKAVVQKCWFRKIKPMIKLVINKGRLSPPSTGQL